MQVSLRSDVRVAPPIPTCLKFETKKIQSPKPVASRNGQKKKTGHAAN